MPRVQPRLLSGDERMKLLDEFWTMLALLETRDEVKNFFKDLLSETEAVMLARRIQIAKMLIQGAGYENIRMKLKTSYVTIASVHRWLQGGFGGYEKLLPRLQKELERRATVAEKKREEATAYSAEWLKRRYPFHYLLVNLIDWSRMRPPKKLRRKN